MRAPPVRCLFALALGAAVIAGIAGVWASGSQLVRAANRAVPLPAGFAARAVAIPGSGHAIAAWWLDQGERAPVVLLLHAIRADRSSMVSRAQVLAEQGFSLLLIDLQAHGETPGAAITLGARESGDVVAALAWLRRMAPSRRIGALGRSLGGAAVLLAPQPVGFDAVVLEDVYPRVALAIENRVRLRVGPLAPLLAPLLILQLEPRLHLSPRDLEPIRGVARLGAPVLVVAGSLDRHTTLAESEELFHAARGPKRLWVVRGAAHQDFLSFDAPGYRAEVVRFLVEHLRPS
jgi:pimeloyl-ACP methyl ester carboxylesterase